MILIQSWHLIIVFLIFGIPMASVASSKQTILTPEGSIKIVRGVLIRVDAEGIISGKNPDEYDIETVSIASFVYTFRLNLEKHTKPLILYINRIWNLYFGHNCKLVEKIASEIVTEVSKQRQTSQSNLLKNKEFFQAIEKLDSMKLQFFGVK